MRIKLSIVIPTCNEEGNIKRMIEGISEHLADVKYEIVVIDESADRTLEIVNSLNDRRIRLFHREKRAGLGGAYKVGFREAHGEVIVSMDGDGSHDPRYLKTFLREIEGNDIVIGSRYVAGGSRRDPLIRRVLPRLASLIYRIVLRSPVLDVTSGYRAYRRELLEKLDFSKLPDDFSFQAAILMESLKKNVRVKEVPIVFHKRKGGWSKYSTKDSVGNLKVLLKHR